MACDRGAPRSREVRTIAESPGNRGAGECLGRVWQGSLTMARPSKRRAGGHPPDGRSTSGFYLGEGAGRKGKGLKTDHNRQKALLNRATPRYGRPRNCNATGLSESCPAKLVQILAGSSTRGEGDRAPFWRLPQTSELRVSCCFGCSAILDTGMLRLPQVEQPRKHN